MLDPMLLIACGAVGALAGVLGGMLGIGGGVVIVPSLLLLFEGAGIEPGQALRIAVATSLASIIATSLSAARAQHRRGSVDWLLFRTLSPWLVLGSITSAPLAELLPARTLALVVACFFATVAVIMLSNWSPGARRALPGGAASAAVGLGAGTVSGAAGIGGGNVIVPTLVFYGVEMHRATGTSSALGIPIAVAGTTGWVLAGWSLTATTPGTIGYVLWPAALAIASLSVLTAPLGVALAHRVPRLTLRRAFGVLLVVVAGRLLLRAFG